MKQYSAITSTYLAQNGLTRVWINDSQDFPRMSQLTQKQIDGLERKGVTVHRSKPDVDFKRPSIMEKCLAALRAGAKAQARQESVV